MFYVFSGLTKSVKMYSIFKLIKSGIYATLAFTHDQAPGGRKG
jgi:hypothetical protein